MRKSWLFLMVGGLIIALGVGLVKFGFPKATQNQDQQTDFKILDEMYQIIEDEAVYRVPKPTLIEGALRGMVDMIEDPYSTYFTSEEAAIHRESLASERVGIGAEITRSNGKYLIVSPVKSSPAEKAGLQPYDEIIKIDDTPVQQASLDEVIAKIRGKEGTVVTLTIYRPSINKHLEISVMRALIPMETVAHAVIEQNDQTIGYISITTFGEETAEEWQQATKKLVAKQIDGLVIDVRGNPGGYLYSVSQLASSLLEKETVFSYMEDVDGTLTPLITEQTDDLPFEEQLKTVPIVLLQDQGSASASEVLSGALKDHKRAVIIGDKSFGKGTVQESYELSNGGELKLSTHKWLTPKKEWIHGKGVLPDIEAAQPKLFQSHLKVLAETYKKGEFHEDIAYAQTLLKELGYKTTREDGYFDGSTSKALLAFQKKKNLKKVNQMNPEFFRALKEEVERYRSKVENDLQLQMALDYFGKQLKS